MKDITSTRLFSPYESKMATAARHALGTLDNRATVMIETERRMIDRVGKIVRT